MYGMERTHNIAALHKHELMARVEGVDCRLSRNYGGTTIAMRSLVRCVCSPPLLTGLTASDVRRAVLNPTDLYSASFVKKSGYRDVQCRLVPSSTELPTDEGATEMNKVRSVQYAVSEANQNCQDKGQIDTRTHV
jgi:hypothetical protein